ncbi:MAG: phosphoglucomutase/phosphomannomutase family protein [Pseudanabaenaceae cyanobacterium]
MGTEIKFGTDGWRGIIADGFTFERVRRIAPIVGEVLYSQRQWETYQIVVGYDRRFLSAEFAGAVAEELQKVGFDVLLADSFAPTPAFSWSAFALKTLGAIVITASHNPYQYSGLKIKGSFGGSVGKEITNLVEAKLSQGDNFTLPRTGTVTKFNPWANYVQELQNKVDIKLIQSLVASQTLTIYADAMHGSAAGGLAKLLGVSVHELHSQTDPLFGGKAPEPLAKNLSELITTVASSNTPLAVGFAFDGDSDRIACIDGSGAFLSSQFLIPILTQHLVEHHHKKGAFIKTISGSDLMQKVAETYNLPVYETPVGFKYLAKQMLQTKTVIAGEESGGIGYGDHIPERDALLSALYLLETIAVTKTNLLDLYRQLQAKVGYYFSYDRIDQHLSSPQAVEKVYQELATNPPSAIADIPVISVSNPDGFKFRLANQGWLLVRFSGTEPVLRMYCEAPTKTEVSSILEWIQTLVNRICRTT